MSLVLVGAAIILMLVASITDFLYYRIPNIIVGLLFVLFLLFTLSTGQSIAFQPYLLFFIILICGMILFSFGLIGGGDAKFLPVVTLWIGSSKVLSFLILMGIIGGALGLVLLLMPNLIRVITTKARFFLQKQQILSPFIQCLIGTPTEEIEQDIQAMQQARMVPYAIAITAAALVLI